MLLVVGFLISGGDTPDYTADDREWTRWADDNELKGRIGALLTLLGGLCVLALRGDDPKRARECGGHGSRLCTTRGSRSEVP